MVKIGDIIFCLTSSDKEKSYWICRQVAATDPVGRVTHIQSVDKPEVTSPIHLFAEYRVPKQSPFLHNFARYLQKAHSGRVDKEVPDRDLDEIIQVLFTPLHSPHPHYIQRGDQNTF